MGQHLLREGVKKPGHSTFRPTVREGGDFDPFFQWNVTLCYSKHILYNLIKRGLQNAFLMHLTPLLYRYLTDL